MRISFSFSFQWCNLYQLYACTYSYTYTIRYVQWPLYAYFANPRSRPVRFSSFSNVNLQGPIKRTRFPARTPLKQLELWDLGGVLLKQRESENPLPRGGVPLKQLESGSGGSPSWGAPEAARVPEPV